MKATAPKIVIFESSKMTVKPELDGRYRDKVLFPEKVAQAKAFLEKHGLPEGWGTFKPRQEK